MAKKFDGVVIFSDFDNTLTYKGSMSGTCKHFNINPNNYEAVKYFTQNGGKFIMATGRNYNELLFLLDKMPMYEVAICTNGTLYNLKTNEEYLSVELEDDFIETVAKDLFSKFDIRHCRIVDGDYNNCEWNKTESGISFFEHAKIHDKKPYHKLTFSGDGDVKYIKNLYTYLKNKYKDEYTVECSAPDFMELYAKGGGKKNAIRELVKRIGDVKKIICVGDQENDIPMLEIADVGVCVANGAQRAKDVASVICTTNEEGAIADVVRMLEEGIIKT
ncbi:MAG: HAD-IIB family hydrolase [Clostridia bacterium]|nr:HAD-IIB family hydrolase [Clostridia bacterium]